MEMAVPWEREVLQHQTEFIDSNDENESSIIKNNVIVLTNKTDNSMIRLLGDIDFSMTKDLALHSQGIKNLPINFGRFLTSLTRLDLSYNNIKDLPSSFRFLETLEILSLHHNYIKTLPMVVTEIHTLKVLKLSSNRLKALPKSLGNLKNLETLILTSNKLESLPITCEKLNKLKILDISRNEFKNLPKCVTDGMLSLATLNVSYNTDISLVNAPASQKLNRLYATDLGKDVDFPIWLLTGHVPKLKVLDFNDSEFKTFEFPNKLSYLGIKKLSLINCGFYDTFINKLTSCTDQLQSLKISNTSLKGNVFWTMPIENIMNPYLLTEIEVRATRLPTITESIENFVNLIKLDIGKNNLYCLPPQICKLSKLQVLIIDECKLTSLPDDIGEMIALKEIKANGNNLAKLPESVRNLKNLLYFDLYENEFFEIPEEVNLIDQLVGFDIDQNSCWIDDVYIRNIEYEVFREALRSQYQTSGYVRLTGPVKSSRESSVSNSSSMPCYEWITNAPDNHDDLMKAEEDWNVSDNSADEFDPNCDIKQSQRQSWCFYANMQAYSYNFCPADLHQISVKQQIAQMRKNGEINDHYEAHEGQFDDA